MKYFLLFVFVFVMTAKSDEATGIDVEAYVDFYVATDNNQMVHAGVKDRGYAVVNNKKGGLGLNLAQLKLSKSSENYRGVLVVQYGDLANSAYGTFDQTTNPYNILQKANVGVQLADGLWLDAGIFSTLIGGESLTPRDNWLTSHSMVTYAEPFFHQGARLSYDFNDNLSAGVQIYNSSWTMIDDNDAKTLGFNIGYSADDWSLGYAGTYGEEPKDNGTTITDEDGEEIAVMENLMDMYHNVTLGYTLSESFETKAQFDIATIAEGADADAMPATSWMGFSVQARYHISQSFRATGRFAWWNSDDGLEATKTDDTGMGITVGVEYLPTSNSYLRLEGRMISWGDESEQFMVGDEASDVRNELLLNFGVYFN
jgi:Putative beta-barrel porin-2, OmpL-like. bbp2